RRTQRRERAPRTRARAASWQLHSDADRVEHLPRRDVELLHSRRGVVLITKEEARADERRDAKDLPGELHAEDRFDRCVGARDASREGERRRAPLERAEVHTRAGAELEPEPGSQRDA